MEERAKPNFTTVKDVEVEFDKLSNITDRVALMNSEYEAELEPAFREMENFIANARQWDISDLLPEVRQFYLSSISFHREIVAEILAEARSLLMENRRHYLKRLAHYHKGLSQWLQELEESHSA